MAERPVEVDWAVDEDLDVTLTVTFTVNHSTDLDKFIPYIKQDLQVLAHDTFDQHWD